MDASFGSIVRLFVAIALIFASLQRSEAFSWSKEPAKPTIVIEDGVNNKNVRLVWDFVLDSVENLVAVVIEREDDDGGNRIEIATRFKGTVYKLNTQNTDFDKLYQAVLENQLLIFNVNNVKEYKYIVTVRFSRSGTPEFETSTVDVKVFVPPRITVPPVRTSRVDAGQNLTLTCNASGDPRPNITWTREGATQAYQLVNATGYRLYLVNIQKKDVGSYRCTANNAYGTANSLALVNLKCPSNQCDLFTVGIKILGLEFKDAYRNRASVEFQQLASNMSAAITGPYSRPENAAKQLYEVAIEEFRAGSVMTVAQLQFQKGVSDPLKPLRDDMNDRTLGMFTVDRNLVLNPTTPPPTSPTGETTSGTQKGPDAGARSNSGLSDAAMWGIIGGCIAFVLIIAIVILVCCICRKKKNSGGATKGKYSEADGYRMNRQPPPSGLGTASPAYVEARMYAPANAPRRQDNQEKPINYADLSFDKSGKPPPPRYGTDTHYSEMSPEKRPPPGGGGGQQGEGGFELWC